MSRLCNLQVQINGEETFFLNEKVISTYSEKLKKIVKQERRRAHQNMMMMKKKILAIEIDDFPGGPDGFELISRFCHNNGNNNNAIYDVNFVIRLVRVFVNSEDLITTEKLKKVGRLIDNYLSEISPDQSLKISKFLGVAQSLPHSSRDSFDGVYRAIDIYLESHPTLSSEERSKLCKCLKFEKLSLETCKELAKNPKIPPEITIEALIKQQSKIVLSTNNYNEFGDDHHFPSLTSKIASRNNKGAFYGGCNNNSEKITEEKEFVEQNLQRMQRRVMELEKVCREMKGQMSRMVKHSVFATPHSKTLPRLC
uniref:NPH3 domain-containing protein n=1 Tax=Cannabis sativa TaxID=3483 RepID=A0A803R9M3_CANSA